MDRVISADGTVIACERSGSGSPLVLVHGTGRDRSCWSRVLPALTSHATVYAINRRGRGSSGDADSYSVEREIEDILAVVDAAGEPVHLLGHSYGAIVALELATRTDRLRSLILYEPPIAVEGADRVPSNLGDRLEEIMDTGGREAVLTTFLREGPRYTPEEIEAQRERADWPERLAFAHTLPRETRTVGRYEFDPERVANVQTPTLLLLGGESPPFFGQAIQALNAALPYCEMVVLEGQRHIAMETAATLFAETVLGFIGYHHAGGDRQDQAITGDYS